MNDTTLLWLDIETTGLNPSRHALLEVAMRATRADLEPYAEYHAILAYNGVTDDFIRGMHGPNGLLDECAGPDALPFSQAIRGMRDFVDGLPTMRSYRPARRSDSTVTGWTISAQASSPAVRTVRSTYPPC